MDAKSLMIGDWVLIETVQVRVIRLYEHFLDVRTKRGTEIHLEYVDVSPIPISEDWLVANGFTGTAHLYAYGLTEEFPGVIVFRKEESDGSFTCVISVDKEHINVNIKYIHEFQYALRLLGLNDLAYNLKMVEE